MTAWNVIGSRSNVPHEYFDSIADFEEEAFQLGYDFHAQRESRQTIKNELRGLS